MRKQRCEVGNILQLRNREYEVIEVLPRKYKEHDLILCLDLRNGTKECFQRFDVDENYTMTRTVYTQEYKDIIRAEKAKGTSNKDIAKMLYKRKDNTKRLQNLQCYIASFVAKEKNK